MNQFAGSPQLNVFGESLELCCTSPMTGYFRNGFCQTGPMDVGTHTVCAAVTQSFLEFSAWAGNDLITPRPEMDFPGLKEGDRWCLCATRWLDAHKAGRAPKVHLRRTNIKTLQLIPLEILKPYGIDLS